MKIDEKLCYVGLLLTVGLLPWNFHLSLIGLYLTGIATAINAVVNKRAGSPALGKLGKTTMVCFIAYWGLYCISLLWSSNKVEGIDSIVSKLSVLITALIFLIGDFRWLTEKRKRLIGLTLVSSLCVLFLVRLGMGFYRVVTEGEPVERMLFVNFDPVHHNYMSLYLLFGLAFLFVEIVNHGKDYKKGGILAMIAAGALLVFFLIFKNSRGGIVCLGVWMMAALAYLFLVKKKRKSAVLMALGIVAAVGVSFVVLPNNQQRVFRTFVSGEEPTRGLIWKTSWELVKEKPLLGYGVGDAWDVMEKHYLETRDTVAGKMAHNIFLEAWLDVGIMGVVIVILVLLLPALESINKHDFLMFSLVLIVFVSGLPESLFERQLGMLFFFPWTGILLSNEQLIASDI